MAVTSACIFTTSAVVIRPLRMAAFTMSVIRPARNPLLAKPR